jgi:hypothetical protein
VYDDSVALVAGAVAVEDVAWHGVVWCGVASLRLAGVTVCMRAPQFLFTVLYCTVLYCGIGCIGSEDEDEDEEERGGE